MRFMKGGKVEVLESDGGRRALWIPAEIVAGNGHYYSVRYGQGSQCERGAVVGRVPRKHIRPPPPSVDLSRSRAPGDVAEMFDRGVWKPVQVSNVAGNGCYLVHLPGCMETLEVHGSDLRVRQIWQDDQWRLVGKESGVEPDQSFDRQDPDCCERLEEVVNVGQSRKRKLIVASRGVKRVSAASTLRAQARRHATKMLITLGSDGMEWTQSEDYFPQFPEKVTKLERHVQA